MKHTPLLSPTVKKLILYRLPLAAWMAAFNEKLGVPRGLAAMGVTPAMLPAIAEAATKDHCHPTNPRPATVADYQAILEQSMG